MVDSGEGSSDQPQAWGIEIPAAARILTELAALHGTTTPSVEVEREFQRLLGGAGSADLEPGGWENAWQQAAKDLGLRSVDNSSPLAEAIDAIDDTHLVVIRRAVEPAQDAEGNGVVQPSQWIVLRNGRGSGFERALVSSGSSGILPFEPAEHDQLAEELNLDAGDEIQWSLVGPLHPVKAAAVTSGPAPHPMRRLITFLRPDRGDIYAVLAFGIATGVLLLATPVAVQALVNFVALGGSASQLLVVALLVFLGLGIAGVLTAIQTWVVELLQRRIFVRTVAELAARLPRVRLDAYDKKYGPELVNRFFDVITIQKTSAKLLLDGLGLVLSILVGLTLLASYHPILLAFDLVLIFSIVVIVLAPIKPGISTAISESNAKYAMAAWLEELAGNPSLFKFSGSTNWAFERSDSLAREYIRARSGHFRVLFGQIMATLLLQVAASTALLSLGGFLVMHGSLTLGQLVAAEIIVTLVVASVAKMGKHIESFYDLMAAVKKVGVLLDLPLEDQGEQHYVPGSGTGGSELEFHGLTFRHPAGGTLLDSLSLKVPAGSSLGFTGSSGSGKTRLTEILWRLRDPASGSVSLDGHDLRDLHADSLRRIVALAGSTGVVEGSLEENVRLHRSWISDQDVHAALEAVGLEEAAARIGGIGQSTLQRDGSPLSQGETARLLLARAIVGRPRVLVIDGLLDGLSEEKCKRMCKMLFAEDAPWTLILTSTASDVLDHCDQIVRLDGESEVAA